MVTFGNTSPVLICLPVGRFLLQRGHRAVNDKPHGMIPLDLQPQLPAAADLIGRQMQQQQPKPLQPRRLQRLGQTQAADSVEKILGDQPRQEQRIVGPAAVGANRGDGVRHG